MPPRKGPRNVVKSGNAGNSSKSSPLPVVVRPSAAAKPGSKDAKSSAVSAEAAAAVAQPRPPPMFPVGYKPPVSLLNERCQKEGWERPVVEATPIKGTPGIYTVRVLLRRRKNKNALDLEVVRMRTEVRVQREMVGEEGNEAGMARQLGAVYGLFRFCSHMPLSMVLPPAIRPYWSTLLAEKAAAPSHRDWEWNPDPFAAKKEVEARQEKKREKESKLERDETVQGRLAAGSGITNDHGGGERGWKNVPEVRMTQTQRELVEEIIRRMMSKYPSAILEATRESEATPSTLPSGANTPGFDPTAIRTQLIDLGFRRAHVESCIAALVGAHERLHSGDKGRDPLMLSLSFLSPFEAAVEWLLVHLPEDDLPARYTPQRGVKDFVSSAAAGSGGQQGLLRGWLVDKVVKAGFPRKAVECVVEDAQSESMALDMIGRRLCGWDDEWGPQAVAVAEPDEERETARLEEKTILSSVLGDRYHEASENEFSIDIDELILNVIFSPESPYPSEKYPTHPPSFYLTSATLPSYIKLHLHAQVLRAFRDPERPDLRSLLEAGQGGAVYAMLEILEQQLPEAVENPPDVGQVTRFLVPQVEVAEEVEMVPGKRRGQRRKREPMALQGVEERQKRMREMPGWDKMLRTRMALPAWKERDRITALLEKNRVLIVVGETGCGKSTQLPQFILDHEIEAGRGAQTRIVVTQPRRVSALGLASRVADERMEDLDQGVQTVGYAIRGESKTGPNTQISFVTTGVILRRLSAGGDADLDGVSHIVVDEVHERSVDSDFLLLQLRELLERNKRIKVILMSATINQQTFIDYFGGAPALEIPGFTHPVQDLYMEDYISTLSFRPEAPKYKMRQSEEQKQSLRDALGKLNISNDARRALEILSTGQSIPYDLIAAIAKHIDKTSTKDEGVLIFMPGVAEVKFTIDALRSANLRDCLILPLHANLSNNEQKQVFVKTSSRKIVVATNVAETSITIPEIVYVIDCGKVKETSYDPDKKMSALVETYTSRAASKQRRGRAGRVKPGVCYKLFTRRIEEQHMSRFAIPEILRTPLESLFLQVKSMDQSTDVKQYLLKAIDPPKIGAIDSAWRTLLDLGAVEGEAMTSHLTALGRHMAALPVDLRLAKMLVLGCVFRALDPVLTIAAMLSSKPLFAGPMEKREEMKRERFAWGKSDILLNLRAYDATRDLRNASLRGFCEENFINPSTIRDINSLRQDFLGSLSELGYITDRAALNINSENENLLKAILTGAFYPRVALVKPPDARFEKIQAGALVKEHEAKEVKFFDESGRVFIHPASILFSEPNLKLGYVTYFHKAETSKPFLFDATEIPLFALLLFGGSVTVNHFAGGLMVGKNGTIRMKAWARIGVLVNQVRRLLDAKLGEAIEGVERRGGVDVGVDVVRAVLTLLG